ncbi:MAG: hypothetical protein GF364_17125 [Candidatus Lokiarchaeota archaeon]|nr:hypothetical protein [Candidatus Lokiarchaeota archaeon]
MNWRETQLSDFPITFDWGKKNRDFPCLKLQILENYLSDKVNGTTKIPRQSSSSAKKKVKKLKATTLMKFLDTQKENKDTKDKEESREDWKNLLIWGDNLYIMNSLLGKFANSIQLVYIDPPFYTGSNEYIDIPIGVGKKRKTVEQTPSPIKEVAYQNIWSEPNHAKTFSRWFYQRARLIHKLLKREGFIAVRFDYHYGHYAKVILDQIFGESNFLTEFLIRRMYKPVSNKALEYQQHLIIQSDSLFLYRKTPDAKYIGKVKKKKRSNPDPIEHESNDDNVWMDIVGYEKRKKTLYPTENSIKLLKRIISLCSKPDDIVADFFCGSGTTTAVAQELDRRWIGADLSRYSVNEIRKRMLLNKDSAKYPFQLLNLEMYNKHLMYLRLKKKELIAESQKNYYKFILKKFGGNYVDGFDHLQGEKGDAYIHIGDIDSIISPIGIQKAIDELKLQDKNKLVILGWDYFMEVNFFKRLFQEDQKIDVDLRLIPQSLLNNSSDERPFPELPFLEFSQTVDPKGRTLTLEFDKFFTDYHTNMYELDMNQINSLDLIDFWAVDWDYSEKDLFVAHDYSFREIGAGRKIIEAADTKCSHKYDEPGNHTIVLTIVDIFGNETSEYFNLLFR